jgi:site-specific recombinase XerD
MEKGHQSFSILFWLNTRRFKNDKPILYLRLTVGEKRVEISTYRSVPKKCWNQEGQCVKSTYEEAQNINDQLMLMRSDLHRHYNHLLSLNKPISAEILKNLYLGIGEKEKTLLEVFDIHNQYFREKVEAGLRSPASLTRLEIGREKVQAFIKHQYKISDKKLSELNYSFIADFDHFLTTKQHLQVNTSTKYLKNLKQVVKMAVEKGWLTNNPLSGFRCNYQNPDRERLTMDEISLLYNKELNLERLREVRDVYLFCCYTGFAYQDVLNLTLDNIVIGIDGEKWVMKKRKKTSTPEYVPLLPVAMEIIKRYSNHLYCRRFKRLLPVNSNQRYNAYLKEISVICGIKKHLTTHTARHTFATTVTLENDVPIETVSQMLGHKSIRTTQIYAKITQRKISNDMRGLKERLFKK